MLGWRPWTVNRLALVETESISHFSRLNVADANGKSRGALWAAYPELTATGQKLSHFPNIKSERLDDELM